MNKLNGQSKDVLEENVSKIKELFPEAFEEGKIDFDVLKKLLGNFVDNDTERYSFFWNGKSKAIKTALTPTSATLRPDRESSKNWDTTQNIFIEGDNLEVLKVLQDTYRNKVKIIYIDPPYNTGKDFVYNDNFNDTVADYKERTNQAMVSNADTNGRYHTNWLNMMYPRLRLARNLLTDDGAIFISIDDDEITNLRKICDEVFGEENFIATMIWESKLTGGHDATHINGVHEYVLCFVKNKLNLKTINKRISDTEYPIFDPIKNAHFKWDSLWTVSHGYTPNCDYPIVAPDGSFVEPWMCHKDGEKVKKVARWFWSKETYEKDKDQILVKKSKDGQWKVYKKVYGGSEIPFKSIFEKVEVGGTSHGKETVENLFGLVGLFDNPKPVELLRKIFSIGSGNNTIILDFFAGSCTTAHAVMDLNSEDGGTRKFITVQLPEETKRESEAYKAGYKYISDLSKERIRRAGDKIIEDNKDKEGIDKLDIGFKAFTLDSTNLTLWDEKTQDLQTSLLEQINSTKSGRTQEDVLYEVLLKYGVDLATPITEESINGKKVYSIAGGYLLVCLDKDIDLETVSEIAKKKSERVVFYDHGFKDDMVKINAEQTLKKAGIEDIRVI